MTSKDPGVSEHALTELIYRHLKENGFKKAASALKKHAPQVETTNVKVSLDDIFKQWMSEERERKSDKRKAQKKSSAPKPESAKKSGRNDSPVKKVKSEIPAAARHQRRKKTETKTRKRPSMVEGQTSELGSKSPTTGKDSDSDSSLDVEKWKRLAIKLSDADIAKMDAFTNVSTSTAKSRKKQKPAQPQKKQEQTTGNGKALPKKTRAKPTTSPTKTNNVGTPLKPIAFSIYESDKVKTPSSEAIFAETNLKSPEIKMATSLSDQVVTPKTGVSNGLSESDRIKVKRKKKHSISDSDNIDTPSEKAEIENTDDISEPRPTDTPCKKKSKKDVKVSKLFSLETPSRVTDPEDAIQKSQCGSDELPESNSSKQSEWVVPSKTDETKAKKDKSKKVKPVEYVSFNTFIKAFTEDATGSIASGQSEINQVLDCNPAETPSKKAKSKKSKKSKELQEPGDVSMPSEEYQMDQTETLLPSVEEEKNVGSEPVEKQSKKAKKSLLETNGTETPSKKMETPATTSILEPLSSEMPPKKSKTKKNSEANQAVVDVGEGEATKSSSSKSDHTDTPLKKSKRKRTESSGENMTSSVTEHLSKSSPECDNSALDNSLVAAGNSTENQVQECVSAVEEEGNLEPKKTKKKKKEKKKNESYENVEEVPPTPPAEEFAESLPSSEKKKKKKKARDEEMPSISTPDPEELSPKKKKKSSKEKEHADLSEQGLI
ncbi:hypothetical protein AMELA_G00158360 [Ameiurus melas]|uniref:LisH domain-containing protein n=1 Tax=Ameiurus melas TaxID=219545 RepID=A0A7J6AE24_AMEME|nr:hypothetical protein AMELA_G00158360 [Ameiurus melas]